MSMSEITWYDECSAAQIGDISLEELLANDVVPAGTRAVIGEIEISVTRG